MGSGGHISRDVMVQASLDTYRWVPHLGYSRCTNEHIGGKTEQAVLQRHGDNFDWFSDSENEPLTLQMSRLG